MEVTRHRPDVLFVPAHVLPLVTPVPAVVTVHDLGHRAYPDAHTLFQRLYLEWSTRHARRAAHLIADSATTRDDLVRLYGVAPEHITVAHLGVDENMRPAAAGAVAGLRRRLGLAPGERYLLHVGTLQPRKNIDRLIEAFALAAADRPDTILLLAGRRGWGGGDPMVKARGLGVADRVRPAGYVPPSDLPSLYSGAVATVVPSLYEGFGLTALEAMACGTPVASSDAASLPEVVGEAALCFDPLDVDAIALALQRLLDEAGTRHRLAAAGLSRAGAFSWERCACRVQAVLERAGGNGR